MQSGGERNPPGGSAYFALPQKSVVVKVEQAVLHQVGQVVAAEVDEQHVVEVVPGAEAPVGEVRLRRAVGVDAEVQHGEVRVQIEQVVQRLGKDVGCFQVGHLNEGVAEYADGGRGDEVRVGEFAVLAQAQIVEVDGMGLPGVWMDAPAPAVRHRGEDAQVVGLQPPFCDVPVLRQEKTQGRFAQQGDEEHRRDHKAEPCGETVFTFLRVHPSGRGSSV